MIELHAGNLLHSDGIDGPFGCRICFLKRVIFHRYSNRETEQRNEIVAAHNHVHTYIYVYVYIYIKVGPPSYKLVYNPQ